MNHPPSGIIPALVTPLTEDGRPDLARLRDVVDRVLAGGVHGVLGLGGQGEFWAFTPDEHAQITHTLVDHVAGRVPVMIGVTAESTRQAEVLARQAAELGADLLTLMPPAVVPLTGQELEKHVATVAGSTDLSLMLYNHPARARTLFTVELVIRLSRHEKIVGVKDSSGSLSFLQQLRFALDPGFGVFVGHDALIYAGLSAGCRGAVTASGNVAPALLVELYDAVQRGDLLAANERQQRLLPLRWAFDLGSFPVVAKEALKLLGLPVGPAAAPIEPLPPDARERLEQALAALDETGS